MRVGKVCVGESWNAIARTNTQEIPGCEIFYCVGSARGGATSWNFVIAELFVLQVLNVEFFPGPLDVALIHFRDLSATLANQRVFPCVLSQHGVHAAATEGVTAVLQGRARTKSRRDARARWRALPVKMVEKLPVKMAGKSQVKTAGNVPLKMAAFTTKMAGNDFRCVSAGTRVCVTTPGGRLRRMETSGAPLFVKVGRTRWSLAGFALSANEDAATVETLFQASDWLDELTLRGRP